MAQGELRDGLALSSQVVSLPAKKAGWLHAPRIFRSFSGDGRIRRKQEEALYELLALTDALRVGRPREKKLAGELLAQRLLPTSYV